ncbi:uncharacterized protein LOC133883400 [Phragmites australis]|uniref:uncharacterized protein LOC133883400 n=1 Tax=Phragmites australis TaxID=29695 RepID=UPI002D79FFB5|nr:uncharacterized protein LOC133883400 [Phragmites australis]
MEFRFRAGDRRPRRPSCSSSSARFSRPRDRRFTQRGKHRLTEVSTDSVRSRAAGPFHGGPPPFEWEAAARRERIIREEVERRLIEEEVRRELALARARLHGGLEPGPFFRSDGRFVPPPPVSFFGPDGPSMPPPPVPFFGLDRPFMPPPPPIPVGMHPNAPPPALFSAWVGFGQFVIRRQAGFGQRELLGEAKRPPLSPPKHKLELREIEPSESSEVLSSETKISGVKRKANVIAATTESALPSETKISGVKRKAVVIAAITEPTLSSDTKISSVKRKADVIAATTERRLSSETEISGMKRRANVIDTTTEPTKLQKAAQDWSCALCQVTTTSEAGLHEHLQGKKHKANLAQCGASKAIDDDKSGLQATTGNKNGVGTSDAPKKICILVDGVMHEVVQKSNYLWCGRCRVRCNNNVTMAGHLRGRKHSLLNKVWMSIKTLRMNKISKEDSAAAYERKVNENGPTEIPEEDKGSTYMATELNENGPIRIPVEIKKEATDMAEEVNENVPNIISVRIKKEDTDMASEVNKYGPIEIPMEIKQEGSDMAVDVNTNRTIEIPAEIKKEGTEMDREVNENRSKETTDVTLLVPKEE